MYVYTLIYPQFYLFHKIRVKVSLTRQAQQIDAGEGLVTLATRSRRTGTVATLMQLFKRQHVTM
jgi:hypothetical protein